MARKNRITRAVLDGVECVVLHMPFSKDKWDGLAAAHFSEAYASMAAPIDEWVGRSVLKRCKLAVCITGMQSGLHTSKTVSDELRFFSGVPEFRPGAVHPEWGEPDKPHYAIPLSLPVSRAVLFAEELGHDDSGD